MTTHVIDKVSAEKGAIDRLEWRVRAHIAPGGNRNRYIFMLGWEGQIVFYREPIPSSILPGPAHPPRLALSALWINRANVSRVFAPSEANLAFRTELPGDALERIERFRDGGRLFARWEGSLHFLEREESGSAESWLIELPDLLFTHRRRMSIDIQSESFELTRDLWIQDILGTLRPLGRFILEIHVPVGTAQEQIAQDALTHLRDASRAFDEGRYSEVARTCYCALDEILKIIQQSERYGKYGQQRLREEGNVLKGLCNPVRHGSQANHEGLSFDRPLAQHLLACTSALIGLSLS